MITALKIRATSHAVAALRALLVVLTVAALAPLRAGASETAGNSIVRNTITVDYTDIKGTSMPTAKASVDLTINTVAATPAIRPISPSPGTTDGFGGTQLYTARIITNSNGPGAVSFGTADSGFTNIGTPGTAPTSPASIYLGATVLDPSNFPALGAQSVAANASITVAVPNDGGKANDSGASHSLPDSTVVNGIAVNDIVYLSDGTSYYGAWQVTAVTDPAVGTGTAVSPASLTLKNISGSTQNFTPGYGWQVLEAKDVTFTVYQGQVIDPTRSANWVTTLTASMAGAGAANAPVTTLAHLGHLTPAKYVRNISHPVTGSGSSGAITINGGSFTYYAAGVTSRPGDRLEYLIAFTNDGTGSSTTVVALDSIPYYTTLSTGPSYGIPGSGSIFGIARLGATETSLQTSGILGNSAVAFGGASGTGGGSNISLYAGSGCSASSGGALASGQTLYFIYQVAVD